MELSQSQREYKITLTNKSAKTLVPPELLVWMRLIRTFVTSSKQHPKRLSHEVIKTTIFLVGMRRINPRVSCSLLRETTRIWLPHLYLPNLTESGEINGSKEFGALIPRSSSLSRFTVTCHDTLLVTVSFQLMLLHLS